VKVLSTVAGVPIYIVGCIAWVLVPMLLLRDNRWMGWPASGWLKVAAFLLALPAGIALLCAGAQGYVRGRLVATLLVPLPLITAGVLLTPGNLSPIVLAISALLSAVIVIWLLRRWARNGARELRVGARVIPEAQGELVKPSTEGKGGSS